MSKDPAIPSVKSQLLLPGKDPGKDVRMPKTVAVVQLPEIRVPSVSLLNSSMPSW